MGPSKVEVEVKVETELNDVSMSSDLVAADGHEESESKLVNPTEEVDFKALSTAKLEDAKAKVMAEIEQRTSQA